MRTASKKCSNGVPHPELQDLPREALVALWQQHFRHPAPKGMSNPLLIRAIAYEIQRQERGGLKRPELRALLKASQTEARPSSSDSGEVSSDLPASLEMSAPKSPRTGSVQKNRQRMRATLKPGTRLVRNWQGKANVVDVHAQGFRWNGNVYKSLTAIAAKITGTHQSGPRFFRT